MKFVLTFAAYFWLIWFMGAFWCFFAGLHPGGDAQFLMASFVVTPLAGFLTAITWGRT